MEESIFDWNHSFYKVIFVTNSAGGLILNMRCFDLVRLLSSVLIGGGNKLKTWFNAIEVR